MKPINRYQALFVLREILSEGTDQQQIATMTLWSMALNQVHSSRRSIEFDPVKLADDEGIAWNKTLNAIERLIKIGDKPTRRATGTMAERPPFIPRFHPLNHTFRADQYTGDPTEQGLLHPGSGSPWD
jgi:hypothetical protein